MLLGWPGCLGVSLPCPLFHFLLHRRSYPGKRDGPGIAEARLDLAPSLLAALVEFFLFSTLLTHPDPRQRPPSSCVPVQSPQQALVVFLHPRERAVPDLLHFLLLPSTFLGVRTRFIAQTMTRDLGATRGLAPAQKLNG